MIMGMMEEYRGRGADAIFYLETAQEALDTAISGSKDPGFWKPTR